jgi:hypothetical protein
MAGHTARRWIWLDLGAGLVAILFVVGVSVRASFVGSDLRALFAMTATAFYLAGLIRGGERRLNPGWRGLLVSCPGLLGTAALIVNDGLHRLPIPIAVSLTAILFHHRRPGDPALVAAEAFARRGDRRGLRVHPRARGGAGAPPRRPGVAPPRGPAGAGLRADHLRG